MNLVDYLIPSKSRRALLNSLWVEGHRGSVSELARLSGIAFSMAHRELMRMEKVGLAVSELIGQSVMYRANEEHPKKEILLKLLTEDKTEHSCLPSQSGVPTSEVLAGLKWMGAPIQFDRDVKSRSSLTDEEVLAGALILARSDPALTRALPIVIYRNIERLDFERLRHYAKRYRTMQSLGFFLELTGTLAGSKELKALAGRLRDKRMKRVHDFFRTEGGTYSRRLAKKNTPKIALKWHFRMNMGMDAFESLFRKYVESHEAV